jgi:hypothetical protein
MSKPAYPRITFKTDTQLILNALVTAIENVNMPVDVIPDKFRYQDPPRRGR